jgi:hypothetical protein
VFSLVAGQQPLAMEVQQLLGVGQQPRRQALLSIAQGSSKPYEPQRFATIPSDGESLYTFVQAKMVDI